MRATDPKRLRDQGANLFLQFLKSGDRVGAVQFDKDAKVLVPLTPFDSGVAEKLKSTFAQIPNDGLYTDIGAGIQSALGVLKDQKRTDAAALIVLISDGKLAPLPEKGSGAELSKKMLEDVAPELKKLDIKVYSLAFSEEADRDFLSQLAVQTGGMSWYVDSSDKLHSSFADLFLAVKKPQGVPLKRKGFGIDGEVSESTFYIDTSGGQSIALIMPNGERLSSASHPPEVKWFQGDKFSVVTLVEPSSGVWMLEGVGEDDAFATVMTQLKLVVDWPANVLSGEESLLQAQLFEGAKPIALPQIADVVKFGFKVARTDIVAPPLIADVLVDDGTNGDKIANDSIFTASLLFADVGEYKVRVSAQSPTFEREQSRPFRVRPEWITVRVEGESGAHAEETKAKGEDSSTVLGDEASRFVVTISPDVSGSKDLSVTLVAGDKGKKVKKIKLPITQITGEKYTYQALAKDLPKAGVYVLKAEVSLKQKKGPLKSYLSRPIRFHYRTAAHKEVIVENVEVHPTEDHKAADVPASSASSFSIVGFLLMNVFNLAVGGAAFVKMKGSSSGALVVTLDTPVPATIEEALVKLKQLVGEEFLSDTNNAAENGELGIGETDT